MIIFGAPPQQTDVRALTFVAQLTAARHAGPPTCPDAPGEKVLHSSQPVDDTVQMRHAGAMVLELLPYNWDWRGISEIYVNLTRSIGDVHHFAWRARHPRWALYPSADEERYADWTAEECSSRCAEAWCGIPPCGLACRVWSVL